MSTNSNLFVTYFVSQQTENQQLAIESFIANKGPSAQIVQSFTEVIENKRNNKWSVLQKAINYCRENQATLLIAELGTLTSKEGFVNTLLHSNVSFYCCDQPFVDLSILEALYKHSQVQKKVHGRLIKEGLEKTSAKSGNPNAAEVINKVNKPKIDTAIIFAFLLQPIISDYKKQGFSQRQMVKSLNEEGFTAPEGGKWVLSQLQKVLDRVKINEVVMQTKPIIEPLLQQSKTTSEIAEELNNKQILTVKKTSWDEAQVNKILFKLEQIKDIENINNFVGSLLPILHDFKANNYSAKQSLQYLQDSDIAINTVISKSDLLTQLEMAVKHLPTYNKIIKNHISQLKTVLQLDSHNNKTLDDINLSPIVTQLMDIFQQLETDDLEKLEELYQEAANWQTEQLGSNQEIGVLL